MCFGNCVSNDANYEEYTKMLQKLQKRRKLKREAAMVLLFG